jgi:hypothetical protein
MSLIDFNLGDIGSLFKDIREAITGKAIEDPNKKAEIALKLQQLEQAINQGQIEINKNEANNPNWFIAGWRPFIGWIGGIAIAYTFIASPLIQWYVKIQGLNIVPPVIDSSQLFNLVLAMLGFGGYRTFEKLKGIQNKH